MACRWGARRRGARARARLRSPRGRQARGIDNSSPCLVQALHYGPTPVPTAISRCEEFLEGAQDDRSLEAAMARTLAALTAMQGDFDEARRLWRRASGIYEELGTHRSAESQGRSSPPRSSCWPAILPRRPRVCDRATRRWTTMGVKSALARRSRRSLPMRCATHGQLRGGRALRRSARTSSASDDLVTQIVWRIARAKALARREATECAEELARDALVLAERHRLPRPPRDHARRHSPRVLAASGQAEEAAALREQRPRACTSAKGNVARRRPCG